MKRKISILGSTGSIGTQTLEVAKDLGLEVMGLTANVNIDLIEKQAREFKPQIIAVNNRHSANELRKRLHGMEIEILDGIQGINRVAVIEQVDTVVAAMVGISGLVPTIEAIRKGKNIALANKEVLVTAGEIVMSEAKRNNIDIIPVDSEHSAIFQCLRGNEQKQVSKVVITASGGPFRGKTIDDLKNVSVREALNHPTWEMGNKITIDSSTMMNKGLEVIEARWLFGLEPENIQVIIHPQSIIHSMVEYIDGSNIAQLSTHDMKLPIQFALTYPDRFLNHYPKLDLTEIAKLTFEKPDYSAFPCLRLAFEALKWGGTMPAVMNGANEAAVEMFLKEKIGFLDIPRMIEGVMKKHNVNINPNLNDIIEIDIWARKTAQTLGIQEEDKCK